MKKMNHFFTKVHARPGVPSLDEKQNFWVEVVPNGKRKLSDYKTDLVKKFSG